MTVQGVFEPAKARAKLPTDEDFREGNYVAEEKLDGSRYLLYIGYNPYGHNTSMGQVTDSCNTLLSRRHSVKDGQYVDKSNNIPHITHVDYGKVNRGTVLDGEVTLPDHDFYTLNGVMNSLPGEARSKQSAYGCVRYNAFDILALKGEDVTDLPFRVRREFMQSVVDGMLNPHVKVLPQYQGMFDAHFARIVEDGGEGLIAKDLEVPYGKGWSKMKKCFDVSCVIMGFKPGTKKYEGQIGALQLGVLNTFDINGITEVGFASGMDDTLRRHMTDHFDEYAGQVCDIYAQELLGGRLRHPTFLRMRDDINPSTITMEKLVEDFALSKASPTRSR